MSYVTVGKENSTDVHLYDVAKIEVPTLVLNDAPHNFAWTHAEEANAHLVRFFS